MLRIRTQIYILLNYRDGFLTLLDNLLYLYEKRASPNTPITAKAKSTYSPICAFDEVRSNPKNFTFPLDTLCMGSIVLEFGAVVPGKPRIENH